MTLEWTKIHHIHEIQTITYFCLALKLREVPLGLRTDGNILLPFEPLEYWEIRLFNVSFSLWSPRLLLCSVIFSMWSFVTCRISSLNRTRSSFYNISISMSKSTKMITRLQNFKLCSFSQRKPNLWHQTYKIHEKFKLLTNSFAKR